MPDDAGLWLNRAIPLDFHVLMDAGTRDELAPLTTAVRLAHLNEISTTFEGRLWLPRERDDLGVVLAFDKIEIPRPTIRIEQASPDDMNFVRAVYSAAYSTARWLL